MKDIMKKKIRILTIHKFIVREDNTYSELSLTANHLSHNFVQGSLKVVSYLIRRELQVNITG